MSLAGDEFRNKVDHVARDWCTHGLPSHQVLDETAQDLIQLKARLGTHGLWLDSPTMLTATMDDGLGQGLMVIEKYARTIGMQVIALGLMKSAQEIIDACWQHRPEYLGLTVLQYDTEDELKTIAEGLPAKTLIVAGGPVFSGDPEFAERTGTHYAARHVGDFLRFMLNVAR